MIIEHKEDITSNFKGTIIDIETVGEFDTLYQYTNDSREYKYMEQVIFGFINGQGLHIFYVKERKEIAELNEKVAEIIDSLESPFYAFNCNFERSVLFYAFGKEINFDGELQRGCEPKAKVVRDLSIPNYDDPFYDSGYRCMIAWKNGEFGRAIAHNRACLLKERDILMKREMKREIRKPDELKFAR